LNWWYNSGLELKFSDEAIGFASTAEVLEWWKNSGLPIKWHRWAMNALGSPSITKWWQMNIDLSLMEKSDDESENENVTNL